ncbi:MAG TPA: dTDP-glucose 4,6-dehydratase [Anaerolineae bacterium]|nr:dTDP-glucose 4,6-dehydratase [Anaerolineae bacterium]
MKNLLITGGAGFIGSNYVRYVLENHSDLKVTVFDKLTYAGNLDNLVDVAEKFRSRYSFVKGDICNPDQVAAALRDHSIDTIVNFAAESHVDRSLMEPGAFIQTDVFGTYVLLEAAKNFKIERYHQVSTDEVYGEIMSGSSTEKDPLETRSPYSASKAGGDLMVHAYFVSFEVPITITRGSNNIGPYQYPEKAIPLFITNVIDDQPIPLYGDGSQQRDYQFVLDHCEGIDYVLHHGQLGEVYNLGTGIETRNIDMANMILELLNKPRTLIRRVADRAGHDRRYSLDVSKIKALGWQSRHTFPQALEKTVKWYAANEWWWRKLKTGEYLEYYKAQYGKRLEESRAISN